jgi:putative transposase
LKLAIAIARKETGMSIHRLALSFEKPRSTVGRWVRPVRQTEVRNHCCPVSGDPVTVSKLRELCLMDRHRTYGYRRIHALLRREGIHINRKTVLKIMRENGLTQPKVWRRPKRPRRVEKMGSERPNQYWQIDMTSFQLSCCTTLFLVVVIDCFTRQIMGWTLSRRCRASEWTSAVRMALESSSLDTKDKAKGLTMRSDNGSQPCSRKFVEFLRQHGVKGQYTGYNAPDDNAYVERVIRTIKEEEVWPNSWDTFLEAHEAVENYIRFYNEERLHSALGYITPANAAVREITLNAA